MTEAIVLAGGFGTRLQTVVSDMPKSMAAVNGRPFLEYLLEFLIAKTVHRVILSVGYHSKEITDYFGSAYRNLSIDYAVEQEPLGTGGGIRLAMEQCSNTDVLAMNGDTLFLADIKGLMQMHIQNNATASIALRKVQDISRYGSVTMDQKNKIIGFGEKSYSKEPGLINGGIYCLNRRFYLDNTKAGNFSIERDCFEKWAGGGQLFGFPSDAYFLDIGIPEDYQRAQHEFKTIDY